MYTSHFGYSRAQQWMTSNTASADPIPNMPTVVRVNPRLALKLLKVQQYHERLTLGAESGGLVGLMTAFEDFPAGTPIPDARSTFARPIPIELSEPFVLKSNSALVSDAVQHFEAKARLTEDISYVVGAFSSFHRAMAITTWELNESEVRWLEMTQSRGKTSMVGVFMSNFGLDVNVLPSNVYYFQLRDRVNIPLASTALPEVYITGVMAVRTEPLRPKESPHLMRLLFVPDIARYAPAIFDLAGQNDSVHVGQVIGKGSSRGRASWPNGLDDKLSDPLYDKASKLLVWAYESARDCNTEYVRISDGWNQLYCFVGPHTLTVGPLVTPRYQDVSNDAQPFSAHEAFIALLWQAHSRKRVVDGRWWFTPDDDPAFTGGHPMTDGDVNHGAQLPPRSGQVGSMHRSLKPRGRKISMVRVT